MRQDYDDLEISLTISGPLSNLQYSLSSFPPRSQEELASLLITGYGLNRVPRQSADIISDQLLLYFASPLASSVTERLKSWLGAEEISIEPINIATETDPGARFTFRKKVTGQADIIYSVDISNTQRHTWMLDYHLGRDFVIRSFRRDDGSYGSSFSHRLSIDPGRKRIETAGEERAQELKLRNVEIAGELVFAQEVLKKEVDQLKVGSKFNYTTLRAAINDLMTFHRARGYLGVMINPLLKFEDKDVSVTFWISPGNSILLLFRGDDLPKNLKEKISGSWNGRLPQRQAVEVAKKTILNHLRDKGYYEAEVGTEIKQKEKRTDLSFVIAKGDRFRIQQLTLIGNKYLDRASIEKAIRSASKANSLWILVDYFPETEKAIKQLYEENGFLQANIPSPKIALDRRTREINIILTIDEGAPSRVRSLQFKGNAVLSTELIKQGLELSEGKIYRFSLLTGDRNHILNMYKSRGYLDVQVEPTILQDGDQPDIDIQYTIEEGDQHTVSGIEIVGNRRTSDALILRELKSQIGTPLNLENLALSQKSLYDTRLFRSISVYGRSLVEGNPQDKVVVEVEEEPLFQASYGLRYNSEEKLEGFGELDFTNLFGGGRHGLLYYRQSSRVKDLRFSLKEPYLFGKKLNTLFSFSLNKETLATFITDNIEFSLQQQLNLPYDFSLSYFYRTSWIHTYELEPMGPFPFDISLHLSEISAFLVRDKRDHKLDAGKGSFFSLSLTYSPRFLGSDLTYVSFFGQYSLFQTLHPGWVWASNYRIGLADAFDQVLIPSKRFFAGGGDSVRGFQRDFVGPLDPFFLTPEGGESLFVMNQELRFPVSKWLSAVAFYVAGNVYRELTDFNPLDLRHSLGFGLRLNTPVALLRLDYGLNLFPREGERRGVFFLSIGQAF
jgi:outer membrane protein assembly complex protein YaeT